MHSLWNVCLSVVFHAGIVALAMLVLGLLFGATDVARNLAAQLETQVRQHLWLALAGNPLAWICLVSALATAAVVAALTGCAILVLHPGRKQRAP